ncbi:MAG: hypothetical protein ACR2LR_20805, partial [Hassallia sp.]
MLALRVSISSRKMTSDRLSFQFTRILGFAKSKICKSSTFLPLHLRQLPLKELRTPVQIKISSSHAPPYPSFNSDTFDQVLEEFESKRILIS